MLSGMALVWLLTTLLLRTIRRVINRGGGKIIDLSDKGRRMSLYLIARYFIWTVAVVMMLEIMGVHVSVLLAGSAALLVGLGFGMQEIFRDIVSGIFLLFEGTIEVGDVLEVDGKVGRVEEIDLRTSKLITRDGQTMIVPNHKFITEKVFNWSHQHAQPIAFYVPVLVAHRADETKVLEILHAAVLSQSNILLNDPDRAPEVRLTEFQEKFTKYEVKFWAVNGFDADRTQSDLRLVIQGELRKHQIPFPNE